MSWTAGGNCAPRSRYNRILHHTNKLGCNTLMFVGGLLVLMFFLHGSNPPRFSVPVFVRESRVIVQADREGGAQPRPEDQPASPTGTPRRRVFSSFDIGRMTLPPLPNPFLTWMYGRTGSIVTDRNFDSAPSSPDGPGGEGLDKGRASPRITATFATIVDRRDLCVRAADPTVPARADDLTRSHQHAPDHRIRLDPTLPPSRQPQRASHPTF